MKNQKNNSQLKFKLTPSIMTCDLLNVDKEIENLLGAGIDWIHFDLMDGKYVNNLGLCPDLLTQIKTKYPQITIDAHCMVNEIANIYDCLKNADYITIHLTSTQTIGLAELITFLKKNGKKVGLGVDIDDDIDAYAKFFPEIDLITIMSIKAGFAGQTFLDSAWSRISKIENLIKDFAKKPLLQLDGGVRWENIAQLSKTKLDLIVVGSLLFKSSDYKSTVARIGLVCS